VLRGRTTWSIHRSVRSEFELRDRSQRREFFVIRMIVCTVVGTRTRCTFVIYGFIRLCIWEPRKLYLFLSLRLHYTESTSTRSRTYRYPGESSIE
jgi:hypothetical protein